MRIDIGNNIEYNIRISRNKLAWQDSGTTIKRKKKLIHIFQGDILISTQ